MEFGTVCVFTCSALCGGGSGSGDGSGDRRGRGIDNSESEDDSVTGQIGVAYVEEIVLAQGFSSDGMGDGMKRILKDRVLKEGEGLDGKRKMEEKVVEMEE